MIRLYSVDDEKNLYDMMKEEGDEWKAYWGGDKYKRTLKNSITYVAYEGELLCGYVRCRDDDGFGVYICDLLIRASKRGNSIGKQLMERICADHPDDTVYVMSESLRGDALQEALKQYDSMEEWVDAELAKMDTAGALKQPVSDEKRLGFIALWASIFKILWNRSDRKKRKKIRKFIGSNKKGKSLSIDELHAFAHCCAMQGNQNSIEIHPDAGYWKKFQILLSGILAIANDEAMESLATIFIYSDSEEELRKNVEKQKQSLSEWWEIHDTDSAINTIYWLMQSGHAHRYEAFSAARTMKEAMQVQRQELLTSLHDKYSDDVNFPPENSTLEEVVSFEVDKYIEQHHDMLEQYIDEQAILDAPARQQEWAAIKEQMLENFLEHHEAHVLQIMDFIQRLGAQRLLCLNAWDIGRCANVVRWSYTCGYLTEAQAWGFLDKNARRAVKEYKSFGGFAHDYMMGRFFWQGGSGEVDIDTTYQMMEAFKYLFDSKIGMWSQNPWVSKLVEGY